MKYIKCLLILALVGSFQTNAFASDSSPNDVILKINQQLNDCSTFDYTCKMPLIKQKIKVEEDTVTSQIQQVNLVLAQGAEQLSTQQLYHMSRDLKAYSAFYQNCQNAKNRNVNDLKDAMILERQRTYSALDAYSDSLEYLSENVNRLMSDMGPSIIYANAQIK